MNAHTHIDERHAIGANNPPEPIEAPEAPPAPTPFEAIKLHIESLYEEARHWLDGEPIENQGQADKVAQLLNELRQAENAAEDLRKAEVKPFDEAKAEVQTRFNLLIGDTKTVKGLTVKAVSGCKAALAPWLLKLEREKEAAAAAARAKAESAAAAAAEAARAAAGSSDLAAREAAEEAESAARSAQRDANRAAKDKAQASGGSGRAVSLRRMWRPTLTDPKAALLHYAADKPDELKGFLQTLAERDVAAGSRKIPGFEIAEEATAQ